MSVKSAPYYWVECDGCGVRCEFAAYGERSFAVDEAVDELDWTTDGVEFACPKCPGLFRCENCGKPAGDLCGERDYHCQPCWDAAGQDAQEELEASRG
jgi:hypothetical protein